MNIAMLKYLAELANYEIDAIDSDAFFARFPRNESTKELYYLEKLGFVSLVTIEGRIDEIGVNKKTIDYVKSILP